MDSARHANKARRPQQSDRGRGRGRGRGGRPRGGFGDSERGNISYGPVPTIREVVPGASVSIVLKVDQPTGRQVQGIVAELLTRGDHPRGIKVRLQDGRVGRVQKMISAEEAQAGSAGLQNLGRNGESEGRVSVGIGYSDFRTDGGEEPEREEISLADYVVKDKRRNKGSKAGNNAEQLAGIDVREPLLDTSTLATTTDTATAAAICPVCGEFEGDETAVAHHVETHFT